ncbi:MAG: hypothetical protein R3Y09_02460 [Clostridia bacterium]
MYNDYINENFYHAQFKPAEVVIEDNGQTVINENCNEIPSNYIPKDNNSLFSGLFGNTNMPEINSETLILFAIIFFAIYDDFDMDLIIILGILFLLGI